MTKYAWRIAAAGLLVIPLICAQERREPEFERARNVISKTLEDLRHVERHEAFPREDRERYVHAMRDLEDARHDLEEHRLDRERLDRSIDEGEHITHVDMVGPREREQLNEDVREMRRLRDDWHWR